MHDGSKILFAVTCPVLPLPMNGGITFNMSSLPSGGYPLGSTVTYNCIRGQIFEGDMIRVCQYDGTWSGVGPSCTGENQVP